MSQEERPRLRGRKSAPMGVAPHPGMDGRGNAPANRKVEDESGRAESLEQAGATGGVPDRAAPPSGPRHQLDRNLVTLTSPDSEAAEQYRLLFHRLWRAAGAGMPRVLTVTSATAGEGKSLTAANLALIAAAERAGERVLLVDADLRRPSLHALFGIPAAPGLAEVLAGRASAEDAVRPLGLAGLNLLTAGGVEAFHAQVPPPCAALGRVLQHLRAAFDAVYLDVPPLLCCAEGAFLASESDGTVLVVRAGETSRQVVAQAMEVLGEARLLGCVLNGVESRRMSYRA